MIFILLKKVCDFLLVINNNLGHISHRFQNMASFPLKTHIFTYPSLINSK